MKKQKHKLQEKWKKKKERKRKLERGRERKRYSVLSNYTLEWLANKSERIKFISIDTYSIYAGYMEGSGRDNACVSKEMCMSNTCTYRWDRKMMVDAKVAANLNENLTEYYFNGKMNSK